MDTPIQGRVLAQARTGLVLLSLSACLSTSGCWTGLDDGASMWAWIWQPPAVGSDGRRPPRIDVRSAPDGQREIVLSYRNQVRFDRDLTVSVDSVFARLKAGDRDVLALVRSFVGPAYEVLESEWRVRLPESTPQARPASRSFSFASGWSEWTSGTAGEKTVPATLLPLLGAGTVNRPLRLFPEDAGLDTEYRWRAVITDATAEFNALLPRDVSIRAEVSFQIESRTRGESRWLVAEVDHGALEDMARAMSIRVNMSYRQYLREKFGVSVTTVRR